MNKFIKSLLALAGLGDRRLLVRRTEPGDVPRRHPGAARDQGCGYQGLLRTTSFKANASLTGARDCALPRREGQRA